MSSIRGRRRRLVALATLLVAGFLTWSVVANGSLIPGYGGYGGYGTPVTNYPYGKAIQNLPGCGDHVLAANDDSSTGQVALPFTLRFYGEEYSSLYVNNNGNVTFDAPRRTYTPYDFTTTSEPMIAPFLADVDTRPLGSGVATYGATTVDGKPAFCVNWLRAGYFPSRTDKLNSFQMLLIQQGTTGDFDIVLNYDQVQWETGSASGGTNGFGGTPAAVGWAAGDGVPGHSWVKPGSFTTRALLDENTTTGLVHQSAGGSVAGRYSFSVVNGPVTGHAISGQVTSDGSPVPLAPVQICPHAGGACRVRTTDQSGRYRAGALADGTYDLTAYPASGSEAGPGTAQAVVAGADVTQDLALAPPPPPPPAGTEITNIGTTGSGTPVVYWNDPLTLQTQACAGGTVGYQITAEGSILRSGTMTEGQPGQFSAAIAPLYPVHGNAVVTLTVSNCPTGNGSTSFGIYIDPSGNVVDTAGQPIAGASVTLLRSDSPSGPFVQIPDGSPLMSPGNRTNPDQTGTDGAFGWDVVAGYYIVRAQKQGCVDPDNPSVDHVDSPVLTIPPPALNLKLRLKCGGPGPTPPTPTPGDGQAQQGKGGGATTGAANAGSGAPGASAATSALRVTRVTAAKTTLKRFAKQGLALTVACSRRCSVGATAAVKSATARRLGVRKPGSAPVAIGGGKGKAAGNEVKLVVRPSRRVAAKLRKLRKLAMSVTVEATAGSERQTVSVPVTIRR